MSFVVDDATRTAISQALITRAGTGCKMKFYNIVKPAGLVSVGSALPIGVLTFASGLGTATPTGIDFNEAGAAQDTAAHVTGTPVFLDITTSADVVVARVGLNVAGGWTFAGSITNGLAILPQSLSAAVGNIPV